MEFLVTSRVADDDSTPEYHAPTIVRSIPKDNMATAMPSDGEDGAELVAEGIFKEELNQHW